MIKHYFNQLLIFLNPNLDIKGTDKLIICKLQQILCNSHKLKVQQINCH